MLESMEGRRGMPRLKPPFPSAVRLPRPPDADQQRRDARARAGDPAARRRWRALGAGGGPRLWSVTGAVARARLLRGAARRHARELIDEYAGGATDEIGAIVPGGAASGILPPDALDVPLTRDALREWGAGPGSAGLQVFPRALPAAAPARRDDALLRRGVVPEVHAVPDRQPRAAPRRRASSSTARRRCRAWQVEEWLDAMEQTSICGLGQAAPFPVRNAFRHWPELFAPLDARPPMTELRHLVDG